MSLSTFNSGRFSVSISANSRNKDLTTFSLDAKDAKNVSILSICSMS
ncbi:MAG: hypothetical protein IKX59_10760 [Bacteroidales bacterium]|nr:hypothetical protein [Bacteroidales bacterium]